MRSPASSPSATNRRTWRTPGTEIFALWSESLMRGVRGAGDEPGAHAPSSDPGPLLLEARDHLLIELVGSVDDGLRETGRVEQLARLDRQPGQISGVQP